TAANNDIAPRRAFQCPCLLPFAVHCILVYVLFLTVMLRDRNTNCAGLSDFPGRNRKPETHLFFHLHPLRQALLRFLPFHTRIPALQVWFSSSLQIYPMKYLYGALCVFQSGLLLPEVIHWFVFRLVWFLKL